MSGTALLFLDNEIDPCRRHGFPHAVRFVPDDGVDVFTRHNMSGCGDHVPKQRFAAGLVKHFRMPGLETCALARSHDSDSEPGNALSSGILRQRRSRAFIGLCFGHSNQYTASLASPAWDLLASD